MILDKLVAATKARLARQKQQKPLEMVKREALALPTDKNFPFEQALKQQDINFICEVKKASPSKGIIAENFPYLDIAREYEAAGASAISVLTEPDFFLGSDQYLQEIAQNVDIPVLRKDFTVDEYQIYEAKILGASAVLLICAILSENELKYFIQIADSLGLSCLVEAHDAAEIETALRCQARINIIFVSESGLQTPQDIQKLRDHNVSAALIGETFMRAPDKTLELARLYGNPAKTQVKICGITHLADIDILNTVQPDYAGFVFAGMSRRYITPAKAEQLIKKLSPQIQKVGVFVDEQSAVIENLVRNLPLDVVQLHGNEDEATVQRIKQTTKAKVWKAVRVKNGGDIDKWQDSSADMLLFDTYSKDSYGGTGEIFNWQLLRNIKRPFILAGGLNTQNIARAIRTCRPYGVDISSGAETDYIKDKRKIKQLMLTIRKVDNHDYR